MRLHLGGHLSWYDAQRRADVEVCLAGRMRLLDLLRELGVPRGEVMVAAVNGRAVVIEDAWVADGDKVDLYPPIGGGHSCTL